MSMVKKTLIRMGLYVPFLSNILIVLNIYNGDLLGIDENIEYMIWFIIPLGVNLIYDSIRWGIKKSYLDLVISDCYINLSCYFMWVFGIMCNLYWYYFSPFKIGGIRHRTEYYDTRCLLAGMLYSHILYVMSKNDSL